MTDLQAAAERLRRMKQYGASEGYVAVYPNPDEGPWHAEDVHQILSAYLAEHLPDDDVAIDDAWWQSLVKDKPGGLLWIDSESWLSRDSNSNIWIEDVMGGVRLQNITTRCQLRLLATALGVELGEGRNLEANK